MDRNLKNYFSEIGAKGGKNSRRKLSTADARRMVVIREAQRAFKKYYTSCFWSYDPNYKITFNDIEWVVRNLQKNGNLEAWKKSKTLCL